MLTFTGLQNKTSSAVQLKHIPTGLVVKSQATRSQFQNRQSARRLLAERLDVIEKGPESRTALKIAIHNKKKASKLKKSRRKYRKLDAEKREAVEREEEEMKDTTMNDKSETNFEVNKSRHVRS